jgi:hypothetical protein
MGRDQVERSKVTFAIHALMNGLQPGDVEYLAACFDRIEDPTFRWWFQWIVRYVPDEAFIGAVGEIWKLDPAGAADRFCDIGTAKSLERLSSLLETDGDLELRRHVSRPSRTANTPIASTGSRSGPTTTSVAPKNALPLHRDGTDLLRSRGDRSPHARGARSVGAGRVVGQTRLRTSRPRPAFGGGPRCHDRGRSSGPSHAARTRRRAGADPVLATMVDRHLAGWNGPDVAELVQARVERRGVLTIGDLRQIARDLPNTPRGRLEALRSRARSLDVAAELERLIPAAGR